MYLLKGLSKREEVQKQDPVEVHYRPPLFGPF